MKLGNYIEANRSLFDKDLVFVTLNRRFVNGRQVLDELRTKRAGGTPWTCVLSPEGKLLITSDAATGNIGYPTEPRDRAHWELMLRTGTTRMAGTAGTTAAAALSVGCWAATEAGAIMAPSASARPPSE